MIVCAVSGQSGRYLVERELGQDRDTVEGLLAVHRNIVAERLEAFAREGVIDAFGLLHAANVGLAFGQPRKHVIQSLLDRIDVPGCNTHGGCGAVGAKGRTALRFSHNARPKSLVKGRMGGGARYLPCFWPAKRGVRRFWTYVRISRI